MTTVTIRISDDEIQYLEEIANHRSLFKSQKERSVGKVLKALLKWCQENDFNPSELSDETNSTRKLIEQMHLTVPHILYLLRLHVLLDSNKIPDVVAHNAKQQAIEYINAVCGEFQNMDYKELTTISNDDGLKQLPIAKGESHWRMKK